MFCGRKGSLWHQVSSDLVVINNWIRRAWYVFTFSLLTSIHGTELDNLRINLVDGEFSLTYSVEAPTGILALFHTSDLHTPQDSWSFLGLQPVTSLDGSFQLASLNDTTADSGFFVVRDSFFEPDSSLVWISPGEFLLGSPDSELQRYPDEGPQHEVQIQHGFWLSKYEVTQKEFESVMGANPSKAGGRPKAPVENVSWIDASEYCLRLTERALAEGNLPVGYEYRLPTEAEWEYACRAGSDTAYSFGNAASELDLYGWWANNSGATPFDVGLLRPNDWGLYDMHGNVFEWCYSKYEAYPGGEIRKLKLDYRVVRGGAFICPSEVVRSACRFESAPMRSASWLTGFRVAVAPILPKPEALKR